MHKQKFTLLFDLVIFAASFLLAPQTLLAQAAREPLGLDGANLVHMAVSADAHLTFAGCQGPLGIFYSTDFGGTWNDARDDVYTGGEAKSFAIANNTLFAVAGFDLYYTSLAGDRPEWSQLEWPDGVEFEAAVLAAAGNFVVMGQGWLPKLRVYNAATEDLGPEVQIPDTQGVSSIAIDAPNGYVYVLTGSWQATNAEVYRADFDTETGAVSNWVKREPGASTGRFWRVFTAPNGDVYVSTFTFGEGIFKSTNFGDSYTRLKDSTAADIDNQVGFMQFAGDVGLLGEYYSTDGGTTWYFQGDDFLAPEDRILGASPIGTAGVLHPADVTQALMRSDVGVTKTEDLSTQDYPFWLPASSGLQGVVVNDMAQLASDKNVVVLASDSGVAFTNSFLDDDPNWIFPLFPLGAGGGSTAAVFDPNEDGRFFLGAGDVYEGSVTAAGSSSPISWQMRDQRDGSEQYRMVMELSVRGTVLAACFASLDGAVDGALQFYDIANGSFTETDTFLDGRPVNTFVAVNQNLFFAGLGVWSPITGSLNGDNRGVWQSTNGGQSWTKLTSPDIEQVGNSVIRKLLYDPATDTLYAAAQDINATNTPNGTVFALRGASTGNGTWVMAPLTQVNTFYRATALAMDAAGEWVYAAVGHVIYRSNDLGENWYRHYTGLQDETTSMLFFDDLVQGANTGFWSLTDTDGGFSGPVYLPWNGSLGMINILELANPGSEGLTLSVVLFNRTGVSSGDPRYYYIPAGEQLDIEVNQLPGFSAEYGTAKIEWPGAGAVTGRVSFYSRTRDLRGFQFVYQYPMQNAKTGDTFVTYNTIHPSQNPAEGGIVANWLTIANLEQSDQGFSIERYSQEGQLVDTAYVSVPALGRVDFDGGHLSAGPGKVGLNRIVPMNQSAAYMAFLVRYGQTTLNANQDYSFAFPVIARAATASDEFVGISNGGGAQNWITVVNPSDEESDYEVVFLNHLGEEVHVEDVVLAPYSQVHFDASQYLSAGESGMVSLSPYEHDLTGYVESGFYHINPNGDVGTAYYAGSRPETLSKKWNAWNLFLGQRNWLRLSNLNEFDTTVVLRVNNPEGLGVVELFYELGGGVTVDLALHDPVWGTGADSYGTVSVESPTGVIADMVRTKTEAVNPGHWDFITLSPAL